MVMVITTALIETLTKHMFGKFLDERDKIEIGGAPSWYMMPVDDKMCTFAHKKGLDSIDIVKKQVRLKMKRKIDDTIEVVIYDNTQNITNKKEQEVVEAFKYDRNLPIFIKKYLKYSRVAYEDEIDTTFVRGCIDKKVIIDYQAKRLKQIKKAVLNVKTKSAFDELELEQQGKKAVTDPNDPFAELP